MGKTRRSEGMGNHKLSEQKLIADWTLDIMRIYIFSVLVFPNLSVDSEVLIWSIATVHIYTSTSFAVEGMTSGMKY